MKSPLRPKQPILPLGINEDYTRKKSYIILHFDFSKCFFSLWGPEVKIRNPVFSILDKYLKKTLFFYIYSAYVRFKDNNYFFHYA